MPTISPGQQADANAAIASFTNNQNQININNAMDKSIQDGWIYAGAYYFTMARQGGTVNADVNTIPVANFGSSSTVPGLATTPAAILANALTGAQAYTSAANAALNTAGIQIPGAGGGGGALKDFLDIFIGHFNNIVGSFQSMLTQNGEPLISMARFGSNVMSVTEDVWFAVLALGVAVALAGAWCGAESPGPYVIQMLVLPIAGMAAAICITLWIYGATLAVYIPMIPFILFSVTALGWLCAVIEAMVAAPILALGLVMPGQDELGKTEHGLMILAGLFLKPMLMVFAFVFSSRLLSTAITMINYAFSSVLQSVSDSGAPLSSFFGWVVPMVFYAGFITALTHKCFALIHILPNKVLRWIGGQGDDFGEGQVLGEAKGGFDAGAKEVQGGVKKAIESSTSNNKTDGDSGGGGGGAPAKKGGDMPAAAPAAPPA